MKVPYVALDRAFKRHRDVYMNIAEEVWSSGQMYEGHYVTQLEEVVAKSCNRQYGVAVASCTDALYFALMVNGIGEGDEVIVPAYSFIASASCILRAGATPVFVDVSLKNNMITAKEIEKSITDKTKAIIAVNLFGYALPFRDIEEIAKKHHLVLIEDAAQSFGAHNLGRSVGSLGNASCISFDPVKNLGSFGSGGMFVTDDWDSMIKVRALRNHGKINADHCCYLGTKSKIPTAEAGMLLKKIDYLKDDVARRSDIAMMYRGAFSFTRGMEVSVPDMDNIGCPIWHKFVVSARSKEGLRDYLAKYGIETKDIYPRPLYEEPLFQEYKRRACPNTEKITQHNIALPIFQDMTDEEVNYVISMIKKFYQ